MISAPAPAPAAGQSLGNSRDRAPWGWATSLLLYTAFAAAVFLILGDRPLLGPDHLTYFGLANEIIDARPDGDYWRETNSVRSFGVLLAYLNAWTGSHILSMKLMLAATTVLYLLSAELFFGLFAAARWQAVLFALLSAFAVSFGISSWGVTDSTALLPRTLVAPIVLLSIWFWLRFGDRPVKYLAFSFLIVGSLLHLSTFYVVGILGLMELWDFVAIRKLRLDNRVPAFLGGLALAAALLFVFELLGISVQIFQALIPHFFSATQFAVLGEVIDPRDAGIDALRLAAASEKDAWALELSLRPWRNMPLGMANVVNMLSSVSLVLLLALWGMARARRAGATATDRFMTALFVIVPVFAFLPQTMLWALRSFTRVYPVTIEEVRAIGFIMIPALYFVLRLFQSILSEGGRHRNLKAAAVVVATVALPLFMKSIPLGAREGILSIMTSLDVVDAGNPASVVNARSALGIAHATPFYYSTLGAIRWIRDNTPSDARILTDRDEFISLRNREIVGPRQVAAVPPRMGVELPAMTEVFFHTTQALQSRDTAKVELVASAYGADYFVVPWPVENALYRDEYFSVLAAGRRQDD